MQVLLAEEELYWYNRTHNTWLLEGDNNTKFFHSIANGRKRENTIFSFTHEGEKIIGDENLLKHATDYYKTLFGRTDNSSTTFNHCIWADHERLNMHDNLILDKPFDEGEIKHALFQMESNKAAGPDGFPSEFFQSC